MSADYPVGIESLLIPWLRKIEPGIVRKGLRMYDNGAVEQAVYDEERDGYTMLVKSESNPRNGYMVDIGVEDDELTVFCTCKYFEGHIDCKHIAASIIRLINDYVETDEIEDILLPNKNQKIPAKSVAATTSTNEWMQFKASPTQVFQYVYRMSGFMLTTGKAVSAVNLIKENVNPPEWQFQYNETKTNIYYPEIKYDRRDTFSYKCGCNRPEELCLHVKAAFDWIQQIKGYQYFLTLKDFSKEKTEFLKPYGLTLDDAESRDITFYLENGALKMEAPEWLWETDATTEIENFKGLLHPNEKIDRPKTGPNEIIDFELGFLFNFKSEHFKNGF
ncbi:MAG: SWIM zinc finger family protein, partial [Chitinophagaceae bacterium]